MNYQVSFTLKSRNGKTGDCPVSTTEQSTCPDACPFRGGGCYGESGPLSLHWRKISQGERGKTWTKFCEDVSNLPRGTFWRHNQAGDLPGDGTVIDHSALRKLVKANKGKRGFTYTHYPMNDADKSLKRTINRVAVEYANLKGFTINLSANNLEHADQLANLSIGPVVATVATSIEDTPIRQRTPKGRLAIVCPAVNNADVTCKTCQLCYRKTRAAIVVFPVHGVKSRAAAMASNQFCVSKRK